MPTLIDVASIVRSKNAGPFLMTFDIMCDGNDAYRHILESGAITHEVVARLYRVDPQQVRIFDYPAAFSLKITIPRAVPCGDPEDRDVYGAQQHMLLAAIEIS